MFSFIPTPREQAAYDRNAAVNAYMTCEIITNKLIVMGSYHSRSIFFRIAFLNATGAVRGLSISTGNVLNYPETKNLEIALVGKEGEIIYDDSIGYDVRIFKDENKTLEEILRIHEIATQ